jgi:hypothetical protein
MDDRLRQGSFIMIFAFGRKSFKKREIYTFYGNTETSDKMEL